jgi:hypothetical protein
MGLGEQEQTDGEDGGEDVWFHIDWHVFIVLGLKQRQATHAANVEGMESGCGPPTSLP